MTGPTNKEHYESLESSLDSIACEILTDLSVDLANQYAAFSRALQEEIKLKHPDAFNF
jgi:hypothetical protein